MVPYVVDKSSSSSTSCLTDSLYQEVMDQEVGAWLKRVLTYHPVEGRNASFVWHHYNVHYIKIFIAI